MEIALKSVPRFSPFSAYQFCRYDTDTERQQLLLRSAVKGSRQLVEIRLKHSLNATYSPSYLQRDGNLMTRCRNSMIDWQWNIKDSRPRSRPDPQGQGQGQGLDPQGQGQGQGLNPQGQGQGQGLNPQGQGQGQGLTFSASGQGQGQGQGQGLTSLLRIDPLHLCRSLKAI